VATRLDTAAAVADHWMPVVGTSGSFDAVQNDAENFNFSPDFAMTKSGVIWHRAALSAAGAATHAPSRQALPEPHSASDEQSAATQLPSSHWQPSPESQTGMAKSLRTAAVHSAFVRHAGWQVSVAWLQKKRCGSGQSLSLAHDPKPPPPEPAGPLEELEQATTARSTPDITDHAATQLPLLIVHAPRFSWRSGQPRIERVAQRASQSGRAGTPSG
jgi:hypothetical protein